MNLDQLAYYAHNTDQANQIKRTLGLLAADWIEDIAEGFVDVRSEDGTFSAGQHSKGLLQFNYDLGIELEILTYLEGAHWHENKPEFRSGMPFISHIGFHMEPGEQLPERIRNHFRLLQVMDTLNHTNQYIKDLGRTYHYEIYQSYFGPDMKFIWRIEP